MNSSFLALREDIEANEHNILAPFACFSDVSDTREYRESQDVQRTAFQRDRDRVIHSTAYRRLKGKTQVFVAHYGDHFRNRLTHSLEVAQLARDFARNLRVNEDLAETIALAHDLGHTPFGHVGQQAMQELLHRYGLFFEHNLQSRRIVEVLEKKSPNFQGLNLTLAVRDGLMKHRRLNSADTHKNTSLEAQIVDTADHIAYQNHDIDDGIRAGILTLEELDSLEIWRDAVTETYTHLPETVFVAEVISTMIKIMSGNMLRETVRRLSILDPKTAIDIQNSEHVMVAFSPEMQQKIDALRHFLYSKFYRQQTVLEQSEKGMQTIKRIFFTLMENDSLIPGEYWQMIDTGTRKEIVIKDFIAGMTDQFALDFVEKI